MAWAARTLEMERSEAARGTMQQAGQYERANVAKAARALGGESLRRGHGGSDRKRRCGTEATLGRKIKQTDLSVQYLVSGQQIGTCGCAELSLRSHLAPLAAATHQAYQAFMAGRGAATSGGPPAALAPSNVCPHDASPPRGPSTVSPQGLPCPLSHPGSAPRILLRGECSTAATVGPFGVSFPPPLAGLGRDPRTLPSSSVPVEAELFRASRVRSIIIDPSSRAELAISGSDPGWIEVARRGGRCASADPSVSQKLQGRHRPDRRTTFNAGNPRAAPSPLNPFHGRCFRSLSKRHRLVHCRDPVHCLISRRAGHIAILCPQNPSIRGRGGSARDRLGPAAPAIPLHARLRFPPPPPTTMAPLAPSMLHHLDPARRPRESRSTTAPSRAVDQAVFFLRSHVVTPSAADGVNATSPMVVGKALEAQLSVPVHSLRVTAHHPEHFFVIFTQPAHQVNAVRRGSIRVDGACFNIVPWHEHDHATFDSLLLHEMEYHADDDCYPDSAYYCVEAAEDQE
ncbi:hypothetical protein ZWY2020_040388 [Hordeum vulgare]|nr:hypothetical protein ZWY2020_040388 [Hordeum vulgare]